MDEAKGIPGYASLPLFRITEGSMMTDETTLLFDGVLSWCEECPDFRKTCKGTDHPVFCPRVEMDELEELNG